MMNKKYLFIALRFLIVIVLAIGTIFVAYFVTKLVLPFIIGFFIALMINPLVDFLQARTKMPRGFAVISAILAILTVISAAITLIVTEAIQGFTSLSKVVPEHYKKFTAFFEELYFSKIFPIYNNLLKTFRDLEQSEQSTILDSAQIIGTKLTNTFSSILQSLGNGLYLIISKIPNAATVLVISLLAAFFISKDWHLIIRWLHKHTPNKIHNKVNQIYEGLQRALFGFLKAEYKLTFISAAIVFIGLLILQVEHALSIALIIWIVDFLPYIGPITIFLPWVIYSFSTGKIGLGIGLSILYGLIILQRQLLKPKVLSSSIGISPLLTLLTMYAGFKLIGLIGIVVGPLTFIFVKILYETHILRAVWRYIYVGHNPFT